MTDNSLSESGTNNVQIQDGSGSNNDQKSSGIMDSVMEFYNENKFIIYCVLFSLVAFLALLVSVFYFH